MNDTWYDTAQICLNGHVITSTLVSSPQHAQKFCDKCGARTISTCENCNTNIRGFYHVPGVFTMSKYVPRSFCDECSKPYPWTEGRLKAAQELADELDELEPNERETLKKSLDDIVRDTPHATVAATRFKKLVAKAGPMAAAGFKDILMDVISETAKRMIWP